MKDSKFTGLQLDGGCYVFDFINTVNTRIIPPTTDYLESYEDILLWAEKAALLPSKKIKSLSQFAEKNHSGKLTALKRMLRVREVLYNFFLPITKRESPDENVIIEFNKMLGISLSKMKLNISPPKTEITFTDTDISLDEPLWRIMKSAYDILTIEDMNRLKECPSCGWLFIDKTKNGRRRWCDMKVCGSNDKAKRYYHRKKTAAGL